MKIYPCYLYHSSPVHESGTVHCVPSHMFVFAFTVFSSSFFAPTPTVVGRKTHFSDPTSVSFH